MEFAVVQFTNEDDAPGIISTKWMEGKNSCWFPCVKTDDAKNKLLFSHCSPQKDWMKCSITILKKFSNYQSARQHLRDAEDTSNLESEVKFKKPRKRIKKVPSFKKEYTASEEDEASKITKSNTVFPSPQLLNMSKSNPTIIHLPNLSTASNSSSANFQESLNSTNLVQQEPSVTLPASAYSDIQGLNKKIDTLNKNQQNMRLIIEDVFRVCKQIDSKLDSIISNQTIQAAKYQVDDPDADTKYFQVIDDPDADEDVKLISSLPLGSEDFLKLDRRIGESSNFKKRLINTFMTVGGREPKILLGNIMRKLLLDQVAEKYSLTGKSTKAGFMKMSFENTEAYKLILEICTRQYKDVKISFLRETLSDYLMQSKFRRIRKEQRAEARSLSFEMD